MKKTLTFIKTIVNYTKKTLTVRDNFFDFKNPVVWVIILLGSWSMAGSGIKDVENLPSTKSKYSLNDGWFPRKIRALEKQDALRE